MKKLFATFIIIMWTIQVPAQACNDDMLTQIAGSWKPGMKGSLGISGANLVKARAVTDIADNMFRPGFVVPLGLVASYSAAYFGTNTSHGNDLLYYNYTDWFNHYMCYKNKPTVNPDAQIILRITFNDPDIIFSHDALNGEWEENEKDRFGWLDNFPEQKNGIIYMRATPDSAHFTRKPDRWLITYDGKLPYTYVTRLEYLQKLKTKLLKSIEKGISDTKRNNPVRPKAAQEKEKAEMLQKLKDDAAKGYGDWTNRYLQSYKTDEQLQEDNIRSITEMYKEPLQKVEAWLQRPTNDLQQTAIVINNGDFNGFLNEGERGAVILVKENGSYYNSKLPKAVPQVIFVSLTRYTNSSKANYMSVYNELIKRLDLPKLQGLLGK